MPWLTGRDPGTHRQRTQQAQALHSGLFEELTPACRLNIFASFHGPLDQLDAGKGMNKDQQLPRPTRAAQHPPPGIP